MSEQFLLSLAFLIFGLLSIVILIFKVPAADYKEFSSGKGLVFCSIVLLVVSITALYAFGGKEWTADLLKVLIGVGIGGTAAGAATSSISQAVSNSSGVVQALNAQIGQLQTDLAELKEASFDTLNQNVTNISNVLNERLLVVPVEQQRETVRFILGDEIDQPARLRELRDSLQQSRDSDWFPQYISFFMSIPEFRFKLVGRCRTLTRSGMTVTRVSFDNIQDGIEAYLQFGIAISLNEDAR